MFITPKLQAYLQRFDVFLRNHWIGMAVVAVLMGVLGNFAYDAVKPKEVPPQSAPSDRPVDLQLMAQTMRTSASSLRAIAGNHMRSPPPVKWNEAERSFKNGMDQYANSKYLEAYKSFNAAYKIYSDLYEQAKYEGH